MVFVIPKLPSLLRFERSETGRNLGGSLPQGAHFPDRECKHRTQSRKNPGFPGLVAEPRFPNRVVPHPKPSFLLPPRTPRSLIKWCSTQFRSLLLSLRCAHSCQRDLVGMRASLFLHHALSVQGHEVCPVLSHVPAPGVGLWSRCGRASSPDNRYVLCPQPSATLVILPMDAWQKPCKSETFQSLLVLLRNTRSHLGVLTA